jgi:hypothetical protein
LEDDWLLVNALPLSWVVMMVLSGIVQVGKQQGM